MPPAASVMLKQDLALLRAVLMIQGNPVLLRELRKALAAKKTSKAAACCTVKTSRTRMSLGQCVDTDYSSNMLDLVFSNITDLYYFP